MCFFKKLFILLTTAFVTSEIVYAENGKPVEIEDYVNDVVSNNPELKYYEAGIDAAKGESLAAGLLQNPELQGSIGGKREAGASGEAFSISFTQNFDYPGRRELRRLIAKKEIRLAEIALEKFKNTLSAKVRVAAYELYLSNELIRAVNEISTRVNDLVRVLKERNAPGVGLLLEARVIEASLVSLEKRKLETEVSANKALLEITSLSNFNLSSPPKLKLKEEPLKPIISIDLLVEKALEFNPELVAVREEIKAQALRTQLAINERRPSIGVGPYFSQESADTTERVGGIAISVPLNIWNKNEAAISSSNAREEQARASLRLKERETEKEVRENALLYNMKVKQLKKWQGHLLPELKDSAKLGDEHYRLGAVPVATYLETQTQYIEGLETFLNVKGETIKHLGILETLTGEKLGGKL